MSVQAIGGVGKRQLGGHGRLACSRPHPRCGEHRDRSGQAHAVVTWIAGTWVADSRPQRFHTVGRRERAAERSKRDESILPGLGERCAHRIPLAARRQSRADDSEPPDTGSIPGRSDVYVCEGGPSGTMTLPEDFTDRGTFRHGCAIC